MPCLDNFGGPAAWDAHCADQDAYLKRVKVDDPGCGTCSNYSASDYSDEHGMCDHGFVEGMRLFREGRSNQYPIPELVAAHGYVPCEYENYQEV